LIAMDGSSLYIPGPIALFGSGETAPSGQKIFDFLFQLSPPSPRVRILETPAGFELNSAGVAGNVGAFIQDRLQNYHPQIGIVPARKKGTPFSPDDPEICRPILEADVIFMGPGSPTYAVKQLENSLAWLYLLTSHRQGASLALSSATTVAISASALPVYEIYKVGQDLHWQPGLDFFSPYQLDMIFIPHWNNQDGGDDLDTSRCYMGRKRFELLRAMLPEDQLIVGIDENTGLIIDFHSSCMHVVGPGTVTILNGRDQREIPTGSSLNLSDLGEFTLPDPLEGITREVWDQALRIRKDREDRDAPPEEILQLAANRHKAREARDWSAADEIRDQLASLGWNIQDTGDGFTLQKNK
jgi:hypothetical protein